MKLYSYDIIKMVSQSTEAALHYTIARIEKALTNKEYALRTFGDIEEAFDIVQMPIIEQVRIHWLFIV